MRMAITQMRNDDTTVLALQDTHVDARKTLEYEDDFRGVAQGLEFKYLHQASSIVDRIMTARNNMTLMKVYEIVQVLILRPEDRSLRQEHEKER